MKFDLSDDGFAESVTSWLRTVGDEEIVDWAAVVRTSPGFFPTTLLPLWLQEIRRRGLSATARPRVGEIRNSTMPHCHPADCDWRFTADTASLLMDWLLKGVDRGSLIAHIGAPSTFVEGITRATSWNHVLFERNPAMVGALDGTGHQIIEIDLLAQSPPPLGVSGAIVDPPWYPTDTEAFLGAASLVCNPDALVLICQPSIATRPGVADERTSLLKVLPKYGFELSDIHRNAVRYDMPHFEAMSLRAMIEDVTVPPDWRTGDILELRRRGATKIDPCDGLSSPEEWFEAKFAHVRIKLRSSGGPDLASIVSGDILQSVSRRDPMRAQIGFWTSGNRVFALSDPASIGKLIDFCHNDYMHARFSLDRMTAKAAELGLTGRVARRLFDVLLIELQEHEAYLRRMASD